MITLTNGAQVPENAVQLQTAAAIDGYCVTQTLRLVQYDETLPVAAVQLTIRNQPYTPPAGAGLNVRMSKPDGTTVYNPCLGMDSSGIVYFAFTQQMTIAAGYGTLTVEITDSGVKNSAPIIVDIKRNPVPEGSVESSDEFLTLQELLAKVEKLAAQAESSAAAAKTSETNAKASEKAAKTSETNAAGSASTASEKADDAGESASAAAASAAAAKTSETNAKASETAAASSETNAKASETAAKTSETNAKASETAAKTSASAAKTSETNAANSKTAAADSASAAENSASAAADSQKVAEEKAAQATNAAGTAVAAAGTAAADAAAQAAAKTEQQIRRYADDRYARPLVTKTGPAASLEVYPDKQSNLKVYANGFTQQAGSGDPSPTNVRAITNGGLRLKELVIQGTENWNFDPATAKPNTVAVYLTASNMQTYSIPTKATGYCNVLAWSNASYDLDAPSVYAEFMFALRFANADLYKYGYDGTTRTALAACKAYLAARYAAGNPVIVWYVPADESQATDLYAPIILQGGEYRATCLPLTAPLCEGDSVVSWVRSGCDKVVTFDGSEDWTFVSSGKGWMKAYTPAAGCVSGTAVGDWLRKGAVDEWNSNFIAGYVVSLQSGNIGVCVPTDKTTIQDFKAILSARPLTVWYRSTNYTEAADIPVSLETHQQAVLVLDGTDKSHTYDRFFYLDGMSGLKPQSLTSGICSHYQYTTYGSRAIGVALDGRSIVYTPGEAYAPGEEGLTKWKADLAAQYAAGTPVTIVYQLAAHITYAHPAVELPALPDDTGKVTITGQRDGTVTAVFNKSIIKEIAEIKAAMLAMGANLSM